MATTQPWLDITLEDVAGCLVVRPSGELSARTYAQLRDTLVKCAVEEPDAVVVDFDDLEIVSTASLTVLTSAYTCTAEWPGVPLSVVVRDPDRLHRLRTSAIARFIPIHADLESAVAAVGTPPPRRRAIATMTDGSAGALAREFSMGVLRRWDVRGRDDDVKLLVTELVENTVRHTLSFATVRLELRENLLTVAVADDDPSPAVLRERPDGVRKVSGLQVVARLARAWGSAPTRAGGKVVWATIRV
ncbi:STAS domain-containing protein [Prauserella cavernicola]|uniref:STAS domain-containing protein n=1 Tax=Prauserella cavernicola TaxID=2800127 RepID=A0A934QNA9_9PSEU|nr:STAS domain-containing protein [Prauserella cavernicola]MBK1782986.1 STAS domain-containing protein [Prauserella cavernicola]